VLVYMLDHSLTGSVVFEGEDGEDIITFTYGVPTKIRLHEPVAPLGQVLAQAGALDARTVEHAVDGARRLQILLGEYLVGHDLVTREALSWALEAQLLEKIAHLANLAPEIPYAYYRAVDLLEGWGGGDVAVSAPLNPILASVRNWMDRARIRATLNRIGKHALVLHPDAELGTLALLPEEQAVLDAITTDNPTLPQLFKRAIADEEAVSSLVYTLAVTRQFAFKGQKKGPMAARGATQWRAAAPASKSAPPAATSAVPSPRTQTPSASGPRPNAAASARPAAVASGTDAPRPPMPSTPAAGAGGAVKRPATPSHRPAASSAPAIRPMAPAARPPGAAPRANAPQIRPIAARKATIQGVQPGAPSVTRPRGPQPTPSSAPPAAAAGAPRRISTPPDAMKTTVMTSPRRAPIPSKGPLPSKLGATPSAPPPKRPDEADGIRIDVDEGLAPGTADMGDAGMADVEAALEAMTSFRLAEAALQRNDTASALALAEKAVAGDPTQADYQSLVAWIRALAGSPAMMDDAIATMSEVLASDPSNERALLYRGKLFVRTNRFQEAFADFNELLASNPQHREAANELRLLKQRMG
jgi:hypothetical protein